MTVPDSQEILRRFRSLSVWSKGGQRAPHKPLLCLLAISRLASREGRLLPFAVLEKPLRRLLTDFGPPRKVCHPEYPFWALQHDEDIWEVRTSSPVNGQPNAYPTTAALLRNGAEAGFQAEIHRALERDETLRTRVIVELLEAHFPETLHEDILQSLGLTATDRSAKSHDRDPLLREMVLSAYEYRCAVCGFNVRIGQVVVALEAAHIKWHQAGGPDVRENGLALCSLHHKLFDRGAFTVDSEHCALISERAYGTEGFVEHLGRYHKKALLAPYRTAYTPGGEFLKWHMSEVFLRPCREYRDSGAP
jgi:putative restriction endonuclease